MTVGWGSKTDKGNSNNNGKDNGNGNGNGRKQIQRFFAALRMTMGKGWK